MDYSKKKVAELKQLLDDKGINYTDDAKKEDLIALLDKSDELVTADLTTKVQQAVKRQPARVIQSDSWYEKMKDKPYSSMTPGQKIKFNAYKSEYASYDEGVKVKVTERLSVPQYPYQVADKELYMFRRGQEYTMSQEDYEVVKLISTRVKTVATQHKCCGNAVHENIPVFEVL